MGWNIDLVVFRRRVNNALCIWITCIYFIATGVHLVRTKQELFVVGVCPQHFERQSNSHPQKKHVKALNSSFVFSFELYVLYCATDTS